MSGRPLWSCFPNISLYTGKDQLFRGGACLLSLLCLSSVSHLQGRIVPCDFIGIVRSQQSVYLKGEIVSNHDELMSNFFAQVCVRVWAGACMSLRRQVFICVHLSLVMS